MESVRIGELEIAYRRAGDGPPLVLLHGAASDGRVWSRQLDALADELTVIAWDEPGSGGSSDPPAGFGLADYADCLASLIESLGLGRAHVGGLSWGGVIAQELYRRHPKLVGSLILIDTYAGWKGSLSEAECEQRRAIALEQASAPGTDFAQALPGLFSASAPAAVIDELEAIMADTRPATLRRTAVIIAECDLRDLLPAITVPTVLIWGQADARSPLSIAEVMRDLIPGSRLIVIPEAGHVSNMEQPARVNRAIRDFCRSTPL